MLSMYVQVSIFLKDKVQTPTGRFVLPKDGQVPWGSDTPGVITYVETIYIINNKIL